MEPVLIDGAWRSASRPHGAFQAVSPVSGDALEPSYPVSAFADLDAALAAARNVSNTMHTLEPEQIALFLEAYASAIDAKIDVLTDTAALETGLPREPRLRSNELPRTTDQLRQAAEAVRDRSWCQAAIDSRSNIRSRYGPLDGAVVIMGPNNFPLAFNAVAGGDFAAALAAKNPVIAKAHPSHPGTTRILAEAAWEALRANGLPAAAVQMIYHLRQEDGLRLVGHPAVAATAFTGSRISGLALRQAADKAGKLIYLELSGINPVFFLSDAVREDAEACASELAQSCTLGSGQFCTRPGLAVVQDDPGGRQFLKHLISHLQSRPDGLLLSRQVQEKLIRSVEALKRAGAVVKTGGTALPPSGFGYANTLLTVSGAAFLEASRSLQAEAFGPVTMVVLARDEDQMLQIAAHLEGSLTAAIYTGRGDLDDDLYARLEPILRSKAGRLLNDKMPTGVAVTPAMHHGGPYPATGHPGFTSVGIPRSILRFAALHCYDNVRENRLPPELRDKNPTGKMWRLIDGRWTTADVKI